LSSQVHAAEPAALIGGASRQCGIAGIASHEGGAFVYRAPSIVPGEPECALRLGVRGDRLFLTDRAAPGEASSCRGYCGVRGSLGDYSIARSSKRTIRYMDRLKASPNYRRAVEEHEKKAVKPS
jgi:hypothetical protein